MLLFLGFVAALGQHIEHDAISEADQCDFVRSRLNAGQLRPRVKLAVGQRFVDLLAIPRAGEILEPQPQVPAVVRAIRCGIQILRPFAGLALDRFKVMAQRFAV